MNKSQTPKTAAAGHGNSPQRIAVDSSALRTAIQRKEDEFLKLAMEVANLGFWEWGVDANRLVWGGGLGRVFGTEEGSFAGAYESFLELVHPADRSAVQQEIALCLVRAKPCHIEFRNLRADGSVHWLAAQGRPLRNDVGTVSRVIGVVQDITWRKEIEHQAMALDKEALLKGAYRLVNEHACDESVIGVPRDRKTAESALDFPTPKSDIPADTIVLGDVKSSWPDNRGLVAMATYVKTLVDQIVRARPIQARRIRVDLDVEDIHCPANIASACGQIVHELVCNAIQHGFPDSREGEIRVQLARCSDQCLTLLVGDNGVGLLRDVNFTDVSSLGLALVSDQVLQINGKIALDRTWGSVISVTFPFREH
jgi:PAS domain S-box-containing protein